MKKGDIDYEKLYKDSIERAKELKGKWINEDGEEVAFMIFPELKDSDKIKAEIIDFIKTYGCTLVKARMDQWIDWIEKQGEKSISEIDDAPLEDSVNSVVTDSHFKRAEAEKTDFVSGQYVQCRKSFDGFKENESYWFEYIGDDVYIGRSDNILNKKFHITPRQLYRLFSQQHCPKEDNANEETNAPTGYGKYVDECLNEAAKHFFSEGEDTYSVADLFYAGVRCGKSWLEKQGEQSNINPDDLVLGLIKRGVSLTSDQAAIYRMGVEDAIKKIQGEQKPQCKTALEAINEVKMDNSNSVNGVPFDYEHATIIQKDFAENNKPKFDDAWIEDYWQHEKVNNPDSYDRGDEIQFDHNGFVKFCKKYCQKPAEWSEEDEIIYKELHNLIYSAPYCGSRKELSDWLKFLKDRVITTNSNTNLLK